jgi:DNA processing protein
VDGRPALLFVDGDLRAENEHAVAIVGSRTADNEALRVAASLAKSLSERGITIVSGLARGIDTAAHQGAIEGQGRTLAVMGTGIDRLFPPENTSLAEAIRVRGALLSQFPPAYGPTKTTFPARNAVIAGLSKVSVIVAASERSGTRIEIDNSIAQGRPVLLWKPLLASQHWARELAREPLVDFIESAIEIEEMLGQAAA